MQRFRMASVEQGSALIFTLLFLLLFSLLGTSAMQTASLQVRLAGGAVNQAQWQGAADSGLRACEAQGLAAAPITLPFETTLSSPAGVTVLCRVEPFGTGQLRITATAMAAANMATAGGNACVQSYLEVTGQRLRWFACATE